MRKSFWIGTASFLKKKKKALAQGEATSVLNNHSPCSRNCIKIIKTKLNCSGGLQNHANTSIFKIKGKTGNLCLHYPSLLSKRSLSLILNLFFLKIRNFIFKINFLIF